MRDSSSDFGLRISDFGFRISRMGKGFVMGENLFRRHPPGEHPLSGNAPAVPISALPGLAAGLQCALCGNSVFSFSHGLPLREGIGSGGVVGRARYFLREPADGSLCRGGVMAR